MPEVIEPGTRARLPPSSAYDAELSSTAAGHVVAAFGQFDHGRAAVATLPAVFPGCLDEAFHLIVLWALAIDMPFSIAQPAYFGMAAHTYAESAAACGAAAGVDMDVAGLDPLSATFGRTV